MGEYLTPKKVAEKAKVHKDTVWKWLRDETLQGTRINGRNWRIKESDLKEFLEGRKSDVNED